MVRHSRVISCLLLLCLSLPRFAPGAPLAPDQVPAPLKPWIGWALYGVTDRDCPILYNDAERRECSWPARLHLRLTNRGGKFDQQWDVQRPGWVPLPGGDNGIWPQDVVVDNAPATVAVRRNNPGVILANGRHTVSGTLPWDQLPESLAIPKKTGLITLELNGKTIPFPDLDNAGRLWLREQNPGPNTGLEKGDTLSIQVFRRIVDDVPLKIITRLQLYVSGRQREITVGRPLLAGFIPLSIQSPLPAKLENDGRLRVQIRPGKWDLTVTARYAAEVTALTASSQPAPWPKQEVWVFDARNQLRLVNVSGAPSIDPRQTNLPPDWRSLPAYRLDAGTTLRFKVIRRGDPEPEPDKLALRRTIWLDFDGGGYTFNDHVSGTMTRDWRLDMRTPVKLGRVAIDGQPQFITHLPGSKADGVEVRRGRLNLDADSRVDTGIRYLPVVGWDKDFHRVSAQLNLPPGWRLLTATGVDRVPGTWFARWSLLDLFVVLIAALSVTRLWNWRWGLVALVTLALIWHEPGAPRYVWLNVLAAVALLRVLPENRFRAWIRWYRNLSLIALVILAVPFAVNEVRTGLYPQLASGAAYFSMPPVPAPPTARRAAPSDQAQAAGAAPQAAYAKKEMAYANARLGLSSASHQVPLSQFEPNAAIQTGPGLPDWRWHSVNLSWNGPVQPDQEVHLVLLSPTVNLILNLLRVILVGVLGLLLLGVNYRRGGGFGLALPVLAAMLAAPLLLGHALPAHADMPSDGMLKTLRERLLAPPDCLPQCAQSPRMQLDATASQLTLRLEVDAEQHVAVPLPGAAGAWLPTRVSVDGVPAPGLLRADDGKLWLNLARGKHQILMSGPLPQRATVELPLPLTPHRVTVTVKGWTVAGVHDNAQADRQLQLVRVHNTHGASLPQLETGALPPFVTVYRTLHLGLDWRVETRVVRDSPTGVAVVAEIPLLAGESVTTDGVRTKDGKVLLNMGAQERQVVWDSVLAKQPSLTLNAAKTTTWTDVWRLDAGPVWHVKFTGIPVVHHQNAAGRWLPEWRPWPGESVTLTISRPEGVGGRTLTLDGARLALRPGERATDAELALELRSSQGGQHTITLPEGAALQQVTINGNAQPIRQQGDKVTLPVVPGTQHINLSWRTLQGTRFFLKTPRVDLGSPSVNDRLQLSLPQDRWVLFAGGPRLGPAVLFWGVLIVIVLVSLGLGRIPLTPLKTWHWLLLGIGLSQTSVLLGLVVVGWLLALGARTRLAENTSARWFDAIQIGLVLLTVIALGLLLVAVQQGLLGLPQMQITGNGSTTYLLHWFQDRAAGAMPRAWVISVPLVVYRLLMLAWALWLAAALLGWLRWGWTCFTTHGLWRKPPRTVKTPVPK